MSCTGEDTSSTEYIFMFRKRPLCGYQKEMMKTEVALANACVQKMELIGSVFSAEPDHICSIGFFLGIEHRKHARLG